MKYVKSIKFFIFQHLSVTLRVKLKGDRGLGSLPYTDTTSYKITIFKNLYHKLFSESY